MEAAVRVYTQYVPRFVTTTDASDVKPQTKAPAMQARLGISA